MELETTATATTRAPMERAISRLAFILACLPAGLLAAPKPAPIHRTATVPIIDGRLNEACWKKAQPIRVVHPHDQTRKPPATAPMIAKLAWDADYLYISYEVTDANLVALATGRETGPPKNRRPQAVEYAPKKDLDLVEFFIAVDSHRVFWEIHHNAANHLNTLWIELPTTAQLEKIPKPSYSHITFHRNRHLPDDGPRTLQRAIRLKHKANGQLSTPNQPNDRDTGYTGELRLPWRSLSRSRKTTPAIGTILSLLAVQLNGAQERAIYHSSGDGLPNLMYHYSAAQWPTFKLTD